MEPLYDEAGAFRGSHIGEQQRRWAKGEGLYLFVLYAVVEPFDCESSFFSVFSSVKWVTFPLKTWTLQRSVRCSNFCLTQISLLMVCCLTLSSSLCLWLKKLVFSLQGRGTFPCDISVLEIQQDLDWNPKVSTLNVWPLYICDDGAVVFYRLESKRMHPHWGDEGVIFLLI